MNNPDNPQAELRRNDSQELDEIEKLITAHTNKQIEQAYSDGFRKASEGAFRSQQAAKREAVEAVLDRLERGQLQSASNNINDFIEAKRNRLKEFKENQ